MRKTLLLLWLSSATWAQSPLSLGEAVEMALAKHPSVAASQSGVKAAEARIRQARSGWLPKMTYSESWQRSNNPVFVFSSLLTQHQFTESNFALGTLNRPEALDNFQSQVVVEQPVYDAGATRQAVRSAALGRDLASEDKRRADQQVIARVVKAYYGSVLAAKLLGVADAAVRSAEADLNRAEAVRSAGMSTDADVLSIRVHLAAMREQQIRRRADRDVAAAELNETLGAPLESRFTLSSRLASIPAVSGTLEESERESLRSRPEAREIRLSVAMSEAQAATARASLLPQVSFRAIFEADRQRFIRRGGANWFTGVTLRWNLFNGSADRARIEEANHILNRARSLEQSVSAGVRLEVRRARANLEAAQERIGVAQAAVSQADESLRITKNRYEAGLSTVTDLLRNEAAVLEARSRRLAALHDQRLAGVGLELATGTLNSNSEVLK